MSLNATITGLQTYTVTTVDNSYIQAFNYGLSSFTPATTLGTAICRVLIACLNPSNGAKAFWDQNIFINLGDGQGSIRSSVPTPAPAVKDLSLITTDYNVEVIDNAFVLTVKGVNATTLEWVIWAEFFAGKMPES